jgi:hypothetical protein
MDSPSDLEIKRLSSEIRALLANSLMLMDQPPTRESVLTLTRNLHQAVGRCYTMDGEMSGQLRPQYTRD